MLEQTCDESYYALYKVLYLKTKQVIIYVFPVPNSERTNKITCILSMIPCERKTSVYTTCDAIKLFFTVTVTNIYRFRRGLWEMYDDIYTKSGEYQRTEVIKVYLHTFY